MSLEKDVVELSALGLSAQQIADDLLVSVNTVYTIIDQLRSNTWEDDEDNYLNGER
jgi:orotate phosphoribosyltransferase-like protein